MDREAKSRKLRWSFQKISISKLARHALIWDQRRRLPHTTPSLLGQLPTSSSSTQFHHFYQAFQLFITLRTASTQSIAVHSCIQYVVPALLVNHEPASGKYQRSRAVGGCEWAISRLPRFRAPLADQSRPHSAPRLKLSLAANGTNPDPPFQASTDPASSMSLDSLPLSYQNEVSALNREILKAQPTDILQFCANFFNRRLEAQRAEFLLGQGGGSKSGGSKMAETAFPGTNPFGNGNQFGSTSRGVSSIEEEEENDPVASPTDSKFKGAKSGAADSSGSPFTNASPFGAAAAGGAFGSSWSPGQSDANGNMPDEGASGPPSSFRPMSNDSLPANYAVGRRTSVSAESMTPDADSSNWRPPVHTKTAEQVARLRTAVSGNFLFSHLDDDSFSAVLGALVEKPIPAANIKVITQGDPGDYFYVIEKGDFDIYIHSSGSLQPGSDGMGQKVASIGPGGSFGELALMYNAPRAATVVSVDKESTLWQLDRVTFRKILMDSAYSKRTMYEKFLEEVPLLSSLKTYERAKIADALESHKFPAGTQIIREGDAGDAFYLLEAGEAEAYKRGTDKPVKEYQRGDFFGELALLDDKPRQATIVAKTEVKVAKLGRDGFKRLLGPVEGIMRREEYDDNAGMDPLSKYKTVT